MHFLNDDEKKYLLHVARESIMARLGGKELTLERPPSKKLLEKRGVFVTLTENGELRGCIGYIEPIKSIVQAVAENAQNAAFEDCRFLPLKKDELGKIKIEISILSPLEEIHPASVEELINSLKPHIHGLVIRKGWAGATFLPQVWEELPTHEEFLSNLCLKAGLEPDEWKRPGMKFYVYTVEKFDE
ncbi:MAG: AmmeMemoRadiSam system protein A [Candidatus Micrarchaeia archaeon]